MARKSEPKGRQKKRASAEAKERSNQTQPAKNHGEGKMREGIGESPEWMDQAFEEARDLMDQALAKLIKEGKLPKRKK